MCKAVKAADKAGNADAVLSANLAELLRLATLGAEYEFHLREHAIALEPNWRDPPHFYAKRR